MGVKSWSKNIVAEAGIPVISGYHGGGQDLALLRREAEALGFPLLIKADRGGGKGIRLLRSLEEFDSDQHKFSLQDRQ